MHRKAQLNGLQVPCEETGRSNPEQANPITCLASSSDTSLNLETLFSACQPLLDDPQSVEGSTHISTTIDIAYLTFEQLPQP